MTILTQIASYGAWAWIIAGLVLLGLELVVPGGVFVWLGGAAIVTGLAAFVWPLAWPVEFAIFAVLALIAIFTWLRVRPRSRPTDSPFLNRRADRYIGHEAILDEPIVDGFGRLVLDDTVWRINGPNLAAGTPVRVIGANGTVLTVERQRSS